MRSRLLLGLSAVLAAACGGGELAGGYATGDAGYGYGADAGTVGCLSSNECPNGYVCSEFGRCERMPTNTNDAGTDAPPPPEVEFEYAEPISSDRYIYVAMTAEDELARIDGETLAVTATPVGKSPQLVERDPRHRRRGRARRDQRDGDDRPAQRRSRSDEDPADPQEPQPARRRPVRPLRGGLVRPDQGSSSPGASVAVGSFQDVTVVALAPGLERAVDLTVGFRPREVQFDATGNRAYVITQDGVSVIDLGYATTHGPTIVPPIPVSDPASPAGVGSRSTWSRPARTRRSASSARARCASSTSAGSTPGRRGRSRSPRAATDIDLAPNGTRVYAVEREAEKLAVIDIPGDAIESERRRDDRPRPAAAIGSLVLSRDGNRGLLFTNATLRRAHHDGRARPAGLPVRDLAAQEVGARGRHLADGHDGDRSQRQGVRRSGDRDHRRRVHRSQLRLHAGRSRDRVREAADHAGRSGAVRLRAGWQQGLRRARRRRRADRGARRSRWSRPRPASCTSEAARLAALGGRHPARGRTWRSSSQRHPLGRVSFVDLLTDAVRTVTGFDLNSHIVN